MVEDGQEPAASEFESGVDVELLKQRFAQTSKIGVSDCSWQRIKSPTIRLSDLQLLPLRVGSL